MHDNNEQDDFSGEEDFAALLEQSLVQSVRLELGQKVEARILQIGDEWIFLDVGQKGEGVLDAKELRITSYNVCYTKLLRPRPSAPVRCGPTGPGSAPKERQNPPP